MSIYYYKIQGADPASVDTTPDLWAKFIETAVAAKSLERAVKVVPPDSVRCLMCNVQTFPEAGLPFNPAAWMVGHDCKGWGK